MPGTRSLDEIRTAIGAMPFVDSAMTASTLGDQLRAHATMRERDGDTFIFVVVVRIERSSGWHDCGTAAVTLRVP